MGSLLLVVACAVGVPAVAYGIAGLVRQSPRKPSTVRPNQARIRALELELGFRAWDERDAREAVCRLYAQVRYSTPEEVERFVMDERVRLTGGAT